MFISTNDVQVGVFQNNVIFVFWPMHLGHFLYLGPLLISQKWFKIIALNLIALHERFYV